jgi:YggT family protein
MLLVVLLNFIDLFVFVFNILLVVRVLMSYFANPEWRFWMGLVNITEPVLGPVRQLIPGSGIGVDFAPLVTIFLLEGVQYLIHSLTGTL